MLLGTKQGMLIRSHGLAVSNQTSGYYLHLPSEAQSQVLFLLGQIACIFASGGKRRVTDNFSCPFCDSGNKNKSLSPDWDNSKLGEIMDLFLCLTKARRAQKNRRVRVAAIIAGGRLLSHISKDNYLNLQMSQIGQMCFGGLRSSVRELRVAAG